MEITGRIVRDLGKQEGMSKTGRMWQKHEYVLETDEQYPKKVHFQLFGDRCDLYKLKEGDLCTVKFDIESREFSGRWYTQINAYKVEIQGPQTPAADPAAAQQQESAAAQQQAPAVAPQQTPAAAQQQESDDLPF